MGAALAVYFPSFAIEPESRLAWLRRLSFFSYFDPAGVLRTPSIPWEHGLVLGLSTAVFLSLAVWLFGRKQIAA